MLARSCEPTCGPTAARSSSSSCCSWCRPSRPSTCRASTPTSSTRASPPATPATSCAPARSCSSSASAQVVCAVVAVYFGARAAMALRPRRARRAVHARADASPRRRWPVRRAVAHHAHHQRRPAGPDGRAARPTIMVMAPIMLVGGVIMALREDVALSACCSSSCRCSAVTVGAHRVADGAALPADAEAHRRASTRVLREQITGIRVIRAFVRERREEERFAVANTELYDTSLRVGRLMALMFPVVMLVMNASSVAVLWFGGAARRRGRACRSAPSPRSSATSCTSSWP